VMTELKEIRSLCCQLVISPDGTKMAAGDYDGLVVLMDASNGKWVRSFKGHSGRCCLDRLLARRRAPCFWKL
jgi:hypothetical protein